MRGFLTRLKQVRAAFSPWWLMLEPPTGPEVQICAGCTKCFSRLILRAATVPDGFAYRDSRTGRSPFCGACLKDMGF